MKFTSLLSKLIVEASRFEVLYNTYVKPKQKKGQELQPGEKQKGVMSFDLLKKIIFADPDTRAPENFDKENATPEDFETSRVQPGKYTNWLMKSFEKPKPSDFSFEGEMDVKNPEYKRAKQEFERLFIEDLFKQTERLQFYEKAKQYLPRDKRDINQLSVKDLADIFMNFELPEKKRKQEEKKAAKKTREGFKHAGGEILYEDSDWVLIRVSDKGVTGKDAAIYYGGYKDIKGGESDWCTSGPGLTFFEGYIKDGPLYVIFPQDDKGQVGKRTGLPSERYQLHFPSDQYMDAKDHRIDIIEWLNGPWKNMKEFFKKEYAKGLTSVGGTKVEINLNSSSPAGRYIALYGFDEMFDNFPETLEHLSIKNTTNNKIAYDIPKSIGKLKNLQVLMLQGCVRSVPEEIGNLSKLSFLSLPNNPELKTIPESIANLNLDFLNLRQTSEELLSGEGVPQKLKDKMVSSGSENEKDRGFYYIM